MRGECLWEGPSREGTMGTQVVATWSPLPCFCSHKREGVVLFFKLRRLLGNKPMRG